MKATKFYAGLAILFSQFPSREPRGEFQDSIIGLWRKAFDSLDGDKFISICENFVLNQKTLFPNDNLLAMIRDIAFPQLTETEGDCVELAFAAVRKFGYMREKEALDWLKVRSLLAASVVQRIGFGELCRCKTENLETLRGQMRGFFKAEKDRAKTHGQVVESATQLENGLPMPSDQKLIGLAEKVGTKLQALPGGKNAA